MNERMISDPGKNENEKSVANIARAERRFKEVVQAGFFGNPSTVLLEIHKDRRNQNRAHITITSDTLHLTPNNAGFLEDLLNCTTVYKIEVTGKNNNLYSVYIEGGLRLFDMQTPNTKLFLRASNVFILGEGTTVSGIHFNDPTWIEIRGPKLVKNCNFYGDIHNGGKLVIASTKVEGCFINRHVEIESDTQVVQCNAGTRAVWVIPQGKLPRNIYVDLPVRGFSRKGHPNDRWQRYLFDVSQTPELRALLNGRELVLYNEQHGSQWEVAQKYGVHIQEITRK